MEDEKSTPIGPPINLTYSVVESRPALDWVPPQNTAGFVRGKKYKISNFNLRESHENCSEHV